MLTRGYPYFFNQDRSLEATSPLPNIILVGLSGCGKTSVGRIMACQFGWGFLDLDTWIEDFHSDTIVNIIHTKGLKEFRKLESSALNNILSVKNHIISLGGGALLERNNRAILNKLGTMVWIDVSTQIIARRFLRSKALLDKRPLLCNQLESGVDSNRFQFKSLCDKLEVLLAERKVWFNRSKLMVKADYLTAELCALRIRYLVRNY